jgi:hypothetical protein
MALNIKDNLAAPGLVKVGSAHLDGLRKAGIPQAELHASYTDFETATEAKRVLGKADQY